MSDHKTMTLKLIVWRQKSADDPGRFETYTARNITEHHSFLEMLDCVNEDLILEGKEPIMFDHDCREGICGTCSQVINGKPHGGQERTTVCQLHMRNFKDGDTIYIEPWRAGLPDHPRPDRGSQRLDKIIQAGGYTSCLTGGVAANAILVPKPIVRNQWMRLNVSAAAPRSRLPQWRRRAVHRRQGLSVGTLAPGRGRRRQVEP